ncbi:cell division protein FtsA [Candidatus Peregrinibacteria bacterium]|nr:cell division protein FtsA [Candidatus Peregrinibacteria bacterium]
MPKEQIIAGLDIGSSKIRTVIALLEEEKKMPNIIGVGVSPSTGMRRGNVIDVDEAISNISAALEDAERMSGAPIHHVFVGVSGSHIESLDSRGVIAISHAGSEIIEDDINRVLEAAQAVSMPSNRRILRIIPKFFSVDDQKGIKNPVGMIGVRLEVDAHIITGQAAIVKNIEKCVHQAGVDVDDLVPSSLAAAEAVLSRRQKELGVVVIDIGCGGTSIAVFEEGVTLYTAVLPVGGESVTNDVAIGLRTSVDTAEKIKIEYGTTLPEEVSDRETIDLSLISKIDSQKVAKKHLAEIIQARYHEIFVMVKDELRSIGRDGMLPAGVILTGAGVKMPGVLDLAREVLGLPVQIGFPTEVEGVVDRIDDPAYATAIGLIVWGSKYEGHSYGFGSVDFKKMLTGMKGWLKNLLP